MNAQEFKQKFMPHSKLLYRVAYSMVGNVDDAKDLVQDLYLKLWQKCDDLPPEAQTQAYLVTMIRNIFYDQQRQQQLDTSAELDDNILHENTINPDYEADVKEDARQMTRLIDKLPNKERKVVQMHIVEEQSYEQIERDTGLSQSHIRVLTLRARQKLKEQFIKGCSKN